MAAHGTPCLLDFLNPVLTFALQAVLTSTEAHCNNVEQRMRH
jgi:hypothetical protein